MYSSRNICFLFCCLLFTGISFCQAPRPKKHNHPSGKQHAVSPGVDLPLGDFSLTHVIGPAVNYSWCNHRFGGMDVKPVRPVGFTADAGAAWYIGKKETVSGYPYTYPGYIFIHAAAGAIFNPWRNGNIRLTAGPALGIYNGNTRFTILSRLEGTYYFRENTGITPGFIFIKESGTNPLWAVSVKATIVF